MRAVTISAADLNTTGEGLVGLKWHGIVWVELRCTSTRAVRLTPIHLQRALLASRRVHRALTRCTM